MTNGPAGNGQFHPNQQGNGWNNPAQGGPQPGPQPSQQHGQQPGPQPGLGQPGPQQNPQQPIPQQQPGAHQNPHTQAFPGPRAGMGQPPQGPFGPQGPAGLQHNQPGDGAVGVKEKQRFSTPAVAALLLVGAIAASATTAVVMDQTGATHNVTSSFDTQSSSSGENASNPIDPGTTEDIAARVLPSVVSIQVTTAQGGGEGSGSIFTSDGMIVTNNHVVAGAENGKIQVRLNDGRILDAKVVAADPQTDIAVIKAEGATDLQPIELGDSDALNVGESVVAIGSPLGLASTVTTGIVSAKNRPVQATGEDGGEASLIDAIQTDAAINPGNSGGALVNMEGKLVGIPSVIASLGGRQGQSGSIGLGFAIPSNQAQRIAQDLIETGKTSHPIIGAKVNTGSDIFGAEIADVDSGSPAEEAGLKKGDVVTRVDDRPVESGVGLIAAIRSHKVGDTVEMTVTDSNGRNEHTVSVTLGAE